jgi:hypothetical protein
MGEYHAQTKENIHFKSFYASMRIGGPTSLNKSAQAQEKNTIPTNQRQANGSKGTT